MLPSPKTLAHGLSKTRKGSPSIGIHELIGKVRDGFESRMKKAVEEDEALDAAKLLSQKGRMRRYAEGGAIGGITYPLVNAAGEAAKGFAAHAGQGKLRAAAHAAKAVLTKPELAKNITRGTLGGGVIQAVREGVEMGKAKRKVRDFISERTGKTSAKNTKPGITKEFRDQERRALRELDGTED